MRFNNKKEYDCCVDVEKVSILAEVAASQDALEDKSQKAKKLFHSEASHTVSWCD